MSGKTIFYVGKLPVILALIMIGFAFDFFTQLPFMVMTTLDWWFGDRR
jgi:hypothetical protein